MRLIYITREPAVAAVAQDVGVDWIFVDLEYRGKSQRQAGRDTVISRHSVADVESIRMFLTTSQLLVRVNPLGPWSAEEIDAVIASGADIVMLPFFKTAKEVARFLDLVAGRAKTCLLLETMGAIADLDRILGLPGIDFVHVGLNDIHIERNTTFMFEFFADGSMDAVAARLRASNQVFGIGGMARIGTLVPPAERILAEHLRLGSTGVILSRSFCSPDTAKDMDDFRALFSQAVADVRKQEAWLAEQPPEFFESNRRQLIGEINRVVEQIRSRKT